MRIAISGASGFIGSKLIKYCLSLKYEINVLSSNSNFHFPKVKIFHFNKDSPNSKEIESFFENIDIFFNCLGEVNDKRLMKKVNVEYTKLFISIAKEKKLKKWVQLSSVGAYGPISYGSVNENYREKPVNLYERTKTDADKLIELSGINYTILRPSIVFGDEMKNLSLYKLLDAILNKVFFFIGKKGATLNYVHVDDVVAALVMIGVSKETTSKIYILSQNIKIEQLVSYILNYKNKKRSFLRIPKLPLRVIFTLLPFQSNLPLSVSKIDALSCFANYDSKKIQTEINFKFKDKLINQIINYINYKSI